MKKLFGILLLASLICLMLVPFAFAQNNAENGVLELSDETKTVLAVAGSWLLYSVIGLLASVTTVVDGKPIAFDTKKFMTSALYAVIVALLAIGLGIHPTIVQTEQANLVSAVANFVVNTGAFTSVIYVVDKGIKLALNVLKNLAKPPEEATKS